MHTRRFETVEEERRSAEAIENWAVIGHRFRGIIYTWTGGREGRLFDISVSEHGRPHN